MIGRNLLTTSTVQPVRVSADGSPLYKAGGVTIDWTTVVAVAGADVTLPDGDVIRIGQKYLRYGQVITKITASGKFGPYDPGAGDGRQTLARGNAYILDETWLQFTAESAALGAANDQIGGCIEGGLLWVDRVLNSGVGAASLAAGPTLANVEATFPTARWVRN
jgi:hypothetical protein